VMLTQRGFTVYSDWKLFMTLTKLLTQNWPLRVQELYLYPPSGPHRACKEIILPFTFLHYLLLYDSCQKNSNNIIRLIFTIDV